MSVFPSLLPPLRVRAAGLPDLTRIEWLAQQIWPRAYASILSPEQLTYMLERIYHPDALARQLTEGQRFFLLFLAEEAVGFMALGMLSPDTVKLHKLYLLPALQGKGLGREMLAFAEAEARRMGGRQLLLNVNRDNPARYLYEKTGFRIQEEVDIPIGNGYFMNDYIMEKALPEE